MRHPNQISPHPKRMHDITTRWINPHAIPKTAPRAKNGQKKSRSCLPLSKTLARGNPEPLPGRRRRAADVGHDNCCQLSGMSSDWRIRRQSARLVLIGWFHWGSIRMRREIMLGIVDIVMGELSEQVTSRSDFGIQTKARPRARWKRL